MIPTSAALLLALATAGEPRAADCPSRAPVPTAAPGRTDFTGTIVNLSCDSVRPSGGTARCDSGEHYFALQERGGELYPLLLADSPPSVEKLRAGAFTGRQVLVRGVQDAPGRVICVRDVEPMG